MKHNLLIPTLLATALASPFAIAQSAQADAHVHADGVQAATDAAKTADGQVGDATSAAARVKANADVNANAQAEESISGNVQAAANSAVTADAASDDGQLPVQEEEEEGETP